MRALEDLSADDFSPHIGSPFRLVVETGDPLDLTLFEVQALPDVRRTPTGAARPGTRAVSLCWHGPREPFLPQRIYAMEHPAMGRLELFIVPIGPDEVGMRYQAVLY